jgi:hypothetical protein
VKVGAATLNSPYTFNVQMSTAHGSPTRDQYGNTPHNTPQYTAARWRRGISLGS